MSVRNTLILASIVAVAVLALQLAGIFEPLELALYDLRTLIRFLGEEPLPDDQQIIVVAIADRSIGEIGRWPWPPTVYARLVRRLAEAGVSVIGLDIILERDDPVLADALREAGNVVLASATFPGAPAGGPTGQPTSEPTSDPTGDPTGGSTTEPASAPPELQAAAAATGHIHIKVDRDGVTRRLPLAWGDQEAFSLTIARLRTGGRVARPPEPDLLWTYRPFLAEGEFVSTRRLQPALSAADLLEGELPDLRGYVALVGVTAHGLRRDEILTSLRALGPIPGVYIHANAVRSLLYSDFVTRTSKPVTLAITLAIILLFGLLLRQASAGRQFTRLIFFAGVYLLITQYLLHAYNLWVDTAVPLSTATLTTTLFIAATHRGVERQNRFLRATFSKYVPAPVVEELVRQPALVRLAGERREVTILFADIRGFTRLAEQLPAETVLTVINHYLDCLTEAVFAQSGTVDKYLGDGLMAIFGAPVPQADHAQRAVSAAQAMRDHVERLRSELPVRLGLTSSSNQPLPHIGIGINSGEAMVGNVGTSQRLEYTAVGDAVNVAARLQELAGPGEILLSEATRDMLPAGFPSAGIAVRTLTIKGRELPVRAYSI